ncbi:hypothetical protein ACSSS7_005373 [Eimeria intestinalis]
MERRCIDSTATARRVMLLVFPLILLLLLLMREDTCIRASGVKRRPPASRLSFVHSRARPLGFVLVFAPTRELQAKRFEDVFYSCNGSGSFSSRRARLHEHLAQRGNLFRARTAAFTSVHATSASNQHQQHHQQQQQQQGQELQREEDFSPPIDLARALQLLEAASSGGLPFPGEAKAQGPTGAAKGPLGDPTLKERKRLAVIFNCMLHACERQGDALGGFEVYRQMQAVRAPPDSATFHSLAVLMERAGETNGMMKGHEPSLALLGLAISCCSKGGAAGAALRLSQQLQRQISAAAAAAAPAAVTNTAGIVAAAAGLQEENERVAAATQALQHALPSSVYADLIRCCTTAGRYEKALQLYAQLGALKLHQEVLQRRLAQQQQQQQRQQQQHQQHQQQQQQKQPRLQQQQQQQHRELDPETLQHLEQLLRRDHYVPSAAVANAAIAAAAATGRLQLALQIYREDLVRQQQQQQQHGEDQLSHELLGTCSAAEVHAPTTESFLLLLSAAAAQQSSNAVDLVLRDFEQQQQQRQQQLLLQPLDAVAVHAAAAEALAAVGRWKEGLGLLIQAHGEQQQQLQRAIQQLQHSVENAQQMNQQQQQQTLPLIQIYPSAGRVSPYLALLRCCVAAAAPREALGILRLLQQRQHREQQLLVLQQHLQQHQQGSAAGIVDPPELPLNAFAEVMAAAAAAKDWQLLLSVAAEFESPKVEQQSAAAAAAAAAGSAAGAAAASNIGDAAHLHVVPSPQGAAAARAAATAAATATQQHVPLELRIRMAALKLLGLLHAGEAPAAAKHRQQLLLLLQQQSSSVDEPQGRQDFTGILLGAAHEQQLLHETATTTINADVAEALELAQKILGPAEEQQPLRRQQPRPPLAPHARALVQDQQKRQHQELLRQQIRQYELQQQQHQQQQIGIRGNSG